jgi:RNA polymerase sigma-70 factor (ECF subfamily)
MVITDDPPEPFVERDLLTRARVGEAQAFTELIAPLHARLLRQAMVLTGDIGAAEDIVSETRVRAWKNLARYNETCRFSTWLYAILLHCHQEAARRARSRPISLSRLPSTQAAELQHQQENDPCPAPSPVTIVIQNEAALHLSRCIELLPEKHREVIQLRFFEDASLPDMAAVLGCSVGTVKSRLHHALTKLRKMKLNLPDAGSHQQL